MVTTRAQRGTKADATDAPAANTLKAPPKRAGRKKTVVEEPVEAPKPAPKAAVKTATKPPARSTAKATIETKAKPAAKPVATRRRAAKEASEPPADPVVDQPIEQTKEPKPAAAKGKRVVAKKPAPRGKAAPKDVQQEEVPEPIIAENPPQEPQPAPTRRTRAKVQSTGAVATTKKVVRNKAIEEAPPVKEVAPARAATRKRKAEEEPATEEPEPETEKSVETAPVEAVANKAPARGRPKKLKVDHEVAVEKPEVAAEVEKKLEEPKKTTRGRKPAVKEPEKPAPAPRVRASRKPTKANEIKIVTSSVAAVKRPTRNAPKEAPKETVPVVEPVQEVAEPASPEPSKIPVKATPARTPAKPENLSIPHVEDPFAPQQSLPTTTPGRTPAKPENISIPHVEDPFATRHSPLKAPPVKITSLTPIKLTAMEPPNATVPAKETSSLKSSSVVKPGPVLNLANSLLSASPRKAPVTSALKQPPISPIKLRSEQEQSTPGPLAGNSLFQASARKAPVASVLNQPPISPVKLKSEREQPTPGPHFSNSLIHGSARKPPASCFSLPGTAVKATPNVFDGKSSLLKTCPRKINFPSISKSESTHTGSNLFGEVKLTSSLFKSTPMKLKSPAKFPIMTPARSTVMSTVLEKKQEESEASQEEDSASSAEESQNSVSSTSNLIFSVAAGPEFAHTETVPEEAVDTMQEDNVMAVQEEVIETVEQEVVEIVQEEVVGTVQEEVVGIVQEEVVGTVQEETVETVQEDAMETVQTEAVENMHEEAVETEEDEDVTMADASELLEEESTEAVNQVAQSQEFVESSPAENPGDDAEDSPQTAETPDVADVVYPSLTVDEEEEKPADDAEDSSETEETRDMVDVAYPSLTVDEAENVQDVVDAAPVDETESTGQEAEVKEPTEHVPEPHSSNEGSITLNPACLQLVPDVHAETSADGVQAGSGVSSAVGEEAVVETPPASPVLDETDIQLVLCRTPMRDDSYIQATPEATTPLSPSLNAQARAMESPSPRKHVNVEEETLRFGEPVFDCLMKNIPQLQRPTGTPARPEIERPVTPAKQCEATSAAPAWSIRAALSHLPAVLASPIKSSLRSPLKKLDAKTPKKTVTWQPSPKVKTPEPQTLLVKEGPLNGTMVFVDVQSDGKDMGNVFVPLLEDLGAQVVPNWTSNNMGITHVLYKDGSQMTLDKVIASNGDIKCVNVGWALDCEKHGKHMDEAGYLINLSSVPGFTPKPLSKLNANNFPARTPVRTPARTPMKFFGAMTPIRFTGVPSVPTTPVDDTVIDPEDKENSPPKTPYFLHPKELVQKTCPPKESAKMSFDFGGAQTPFRQRLMAAKRRSAEFAPQPSKPFKRARLG